MGYELTESNGEIELQVDELLARDGQTFVFVDRLFFNPEKKFQGAVGGRMVPVTQDEYKHRLDEMRDYEYSPLAHVYDEVNERSRTNKSWDEWIGEQIQLEGPRLILDESYTAKYGEKVREMTEKELGYSPEYVECIGGGRMFRDINRNYDTVYNDELMRMVQDTERDGAPQWASHRV